MVAAVMRHMLFKKHQKEDQPVRREELNKLISKDGVKKAGNLANYVLAQAQAKFLVLFGLEMKLVEVMASSRATGKASQLKGA